MFTNLISTLIGQSGNDPKSVNEIVIALKRSLLSESDSRRKVNEYLKSVREMIYGSADAEAEPIAIRDQISEELLKTDLLLHLIEKLPTIDFDGRKDIALIYEYVIGQQTGTLFPTVVYIQSKPNIVQLLVQYYSREELVFNCGQIIRGCLRFEPLTQMFFDLTDDQKNRLYINFLDYANNDSFDVCCDVFSTLHELFVRHKTLCRRTLERDSDLFFRKLNQLLETGNFLVKQDSVKLLSGILNDRNHLRVMKTYVNSRSNAEIISTILLDDDHSSFDVFLLFYLFVINPEKSPEVEHLLLSKKDKLLVVLERFDKKISKEYSDEKENFTKILKDLNPQGSGSSAEPEGV